MDVRTENTSVVAFQIAWGICWDIHPVIGIEGKANKANSEEFAYRVGEIVHTIYLRVPQGLPTENRGVPTSPFDLDRKLKPSYFGRRGLR